MALILPSFEKAGNCVSACCVAVFFPPGIAAWHHRLASPAGITGWHHRLASPAGRSSWQK
jgi:hypothetical protein